MSWSRWVGCWLFSCCLLGAGCKSGTKFQVLGDSTRLRDDEPSPSTSPLFDGRTLELHAARGETLGFTFRISDGRARSVDLWLPASAAKVEAFGVRSLEVSEPSTSMYGESRGRGRYPDVLVPAGTHVDTSALAYFDVSVPRDAKPGRYAGTLSAGERSIPVVLQVHRAQIDLEKWPLVWAFYLPAEIARVHGLKDGDTPELLALEARYHALFRAHGVLLGSDLPPSRFEVRRRFLHDTHYWPVAIDTSSDRAIESDVRQWRSLFRNTGVTPFAIPVDEPRTREQRARARHIAEVIGRAGGGRPSLLRAVTDVAAPEYGDAFDVFVAPGNFPRLANARRGSGERFWTYNGRPPEAGSMILDTDGSALRSWGWIAYRYGVELWYAWEALYYSDRYNRGGPTDVTRDPLTFDERSRGGEDFGNGDGVLAYPGPLPSLRLKALRRGLADRLLLLELEACGAKSRAQAIARRMVPYALGEATRSPTWTANEAAWEKARRDLLDAIEEDCHAR